jgi:hypothetical protein
VNAGEDHILGKLSDADKDTLIARLWRDLQDERSRSKELERQLALQGGNAAQDSGQLLKKLQQAGAGKQSPTGLGLGLSRALDFVSARVLIAIAVLIVLVFALDFAIGRYQHYRLDQKRLAELRLQHAAYEGMFVELVNVAYEPDQKSYRLTMKITNVEPGRPLYVMQSPVRVFEQIGLSWKEVPSRDPDGQSARVIKLSDAHTFQSIFEPNLAEWTELIPGYMHIRFVTDSLISERQRAGRRHHRSHGSILCVLEAARRGRQRDPQANELQGRSARLHADAAALKRAVWKPTNADRLLHSVSNSSRGGHQARPSSSHQRGRRESRRSHPAAQGSPRRWGRRPQRHRIAR